VSNSNSVTVIDESTKKIVNIVPPHTNAGRGISVNPAANKIYVNNNVDSVAVIDGISNTAITLALKAQGFASLGVNSITGKLYAAFYGTDDVAVVTEQQVQKVPIRVTIQPLQDNRTHSVRPSFNFTAKDTFKPHATKIERLLLQVDTWQGSWLAAKNEGSGRFQGKVKRPLQKGMHILYAYATDGQDATSTNTGVQSSPLIGNITGYTFLVY